LVAVAMSLMDRKNNVTPFIYDQSSHNSANFVTIGPVDVEIIGLTEITNFFK